MKLVYTTPSVSKFASFYVLLARLLSTDLRLPCRFLVVRRQKVRRFRDWLLDCSRRLLPSVA
ncbi:unnamed protein product [Acanthoscelides obtectus]|uniref:Uncharacterized protein n=1 Tax=Acanthoscelides obtectus TaxID=200917 RepID=A0A9P0KCH5_ACAOB|nr:unnamed protein product [Acanthoscelides obtectus]CAK1655984.1 hypothetical protein AOBTE_LOCUS19489 [Acanthoscelides obtectus]